MLVNYSLRSGLPAPAIFVALATVATAQDPVSSEQELTRLREDYSELAQRLSGLEQRTRDTGDGDEDLLYDEFYEDLGEGEGLYFRSGAVDGTFLIFGDVDSSYRNPASGGNVQFEMGDLDVLANVNLGDHFRVLSETVFHSGDVGLERLWGQYTVSDALYFKLGTEHSPIARWNYEFHHGAWLETTIKRPIMDRFEGGNGILPMHRTGLELGGRLFTEGGSFQYFATVSNGRGKTPKDKQREGDANDNKAIDVGVNYFPAARPSMTFGGAVTFDEIPADDSVGDPDRDRNMHEWIATANFSSDLGPLFLRSEYAFIRHEGRSSNEHYDHYTGFVQLELPGELWTPYMRSGFRDMDRGDPFYEPNDRDLDEWRQTLGVRNDFNPNVAIKFEVAYGRRDERDDDDVDHEHVTTVGIQLAWHF